jgi:hypothetical protein
MAWTDAQKQEVIDMYMDRNPTPDNSAEIVKEIATELEQSPNGVRMILIQSGKYVKKGAEPASKEEGTSPAKKSTTKEGSTRVSKADEIGKLKELITALGKDVDDEILDKLTGKAAKYLVGVFSK